MRAASGDGMVPGELATLVMSGSLTRRAFIGRAVALGCTTSAIAAVPAAFGGTPATSAPATTAAPAATGAAATAAATSTPVGGAATATRQGSATPAAATATRAASPTASGTASALGTPTTSPLGAAGGIGPGPRGRGAAGTLKILYWQAPTTMNPHFSSGGQNSDPARLVLERLANFDKNDRLVPWLAADGKSVTWKLKQGVKWSDGQPFTARDVIFTWRYVSTKETGATTLGAYSAIENVEAPDDHTAKVTFKAANPAWYLPFTDAILPEHIFKDGIGTNAKTFAGNLKPIGTGPYVVDDFKPGDSVSYSINPNWRDANGPAFSRVDWKGGGDACPPRAPSSRPAIISSPGIFRWSRRSSTSS